MHYFIEKTWSLKIRFLLGLFGLFGVGALQGATQKEEAVLFLGSSEYLKKEYFIQALLGEGDYESYKQKKKETPLRGYHAYKAKNGLTLVNTGALYRYNSKDNKFEHNQNVLKHFLQAFEKFKVRGIFFVIDDIMYLDFFASIVDLFKTQEIETILPYIKLTFVHHFWKGISKAEIREKFLELQRKRVNKYGISSLLSENMVKISQNIVPLDDKGNLLTEELSVVYQKEVKSGVISEMARGTVVGLKISILTPWLLVRKGFSGVKKRYEKEINVDRKVKIDSRDIAPIWKIIEGLPVAPLGRENFIFDEKLYPSLPQANASNSQGVRDAKNEAKKKKNSTDWNVLKRVAECAIAGIWVLLLGGGFFYLVKRLIGKLKSKGQKKKKVLKKGKKKKKLKDAKEEEKQKKRKKRKKGKTQKKKNLEKKKPKRG